MCSAEREREREQQSRGILCFDGAIKRRKAAVKRIESQVRSADVVKWPRLRSYYAASLVVALFLRAEANEKKIMNKNNSTRSTGIYACIAPLLPCLRQPRAFLSTLII